MYSLPHHQRIEKLLHSLNGEFLESTGSFFGGGTAAVLALGEYRESVDVDFICSSQSGYRAIRNTVTLGGLGDIAKAPLKLVRDVRADQYGIRTFVEIDGVPIKFELIREARIEVGGHMSRRLGVPTLSQDAMRVEKLLANADRGNDLSTNNRDIIDLAMMIDGWGLLPKHVWAVAEVAYGEEVKKQFYVASQRIRDPAHLAKCLSNLKMTPDLAPRIVAALERDSDPAPGARISGKAFGPSF